MDEKTKNKLLIQKQKRKGKCRAYSGFYTPKFPSKWINIQRNMVIEYRSLWERNSFERLEKSPMIAKIGSETVIVKYICGTDSKPHRYFIDLELHLTDNTKMLIEIKPKYQTVKPVQTKGKKKTTVIRENLTYIKNQSKWRAAEAYSKAHGFTFHKWTEDELKKMGIL